MPDNNLLALILAVLAGAVLVILYFAATRIWVRTHRESHGKVSVVEVAFILPLPARKQMSCGMIPSWELVFYITLKTM